MTDAPKKRLEMPKEQPKPPTAAERIAALNQRRTAGKGYIIPPPSPMTRQSAKAWLQAVSELGCDGDVEIAWVKGVQDVHIKRELINFYEAMKNAAGKRYYELEKQVAAERRVERQAWLERTKKANRARDIARLQADIAKLKAN